MLLLTLAAFQVFLFSASARSFWKFHKHHRDTPNAFKILGMDRFVAALRDVNQDPKFKCLTATRVDYDPDVPSATFQWSFNVGKNAPSKNATLHFTKGPSIDTANIVVDNDTARTDVVHFLYADKGLTCAVMELRYFGYQCTLWVRNTTKHAVSKKCFKKHAALCANGVLLYDKDTCSDY
ncbi:uncharacterized protein LOC119395836 [Rhipicephalus sanguineus]|uniref:uncharacterized protein LOC119395836 n=1 Tax=Rhipicephalus sanguineus TaxID=34632 RepID=UPI0020C245EB|nr:uncharacterized protein LOC119395836 [Rhipicephalus sanguineus]